MNHAFFKHCRVLAVTISALSVMAACGGDSAAQQISGNAETVTGSASATAPTDSPPNGRAPAQLDVDPCSLLTMPELEAALGSGVERGGFGDDLPGRCTYSIGGDVGAGVVGIRIEDPLECGALLRALNASSLGGNAVRVDVGDGGVFVTDGDVQFSIGGGCVGVGGSNSGVNLGQDALVKLATLAAGRIG